MLKVCRFCLCDDEECLIPLEDLLDFAHTMQDVALFSGIEIEEDNIALYAICLVCTDKLKTFATFRKTCSDNDSHFRELYAMVATSMKDTLDENDEAIEYVNMPQDAIDFDDEQLQPEGNTSVCGLINDWETTRTKGHIEQGQQNSSSSAEIVGEDEHFYSANYISPGEDLFTDHGIRDGRTDWSCYYCPPKWPTLPEYRMPGKRRRSLCDICGLYVTHMPVHYEIHSPYASHACPHCPVKMKQKFVLLQHIRTVHLKVVRKTCHICNIGFVHRRTYVYHMRTHGDGGQSFECIVCSKVFKRSIGLEAHVKKFHSFTKSGK